MLSAFLQGDLVDTFNRVKAFNLKFHDTPKSDEPQKWNCVHLNIHRHHRHTDRFL
jgi:hypothetical protein